MAKAYSYIRFSTPEQSKGDSLRRQLDASRVYAEKHGLELDDSLRDIGVSAFRGKNASEGALSWFLELVRSGRIEKGSYLLVESLDRLSRDDVTEAQELLMGLVRSGITVVTMMDGQVYSRETLKGAGWMNIVGSIMIMARANEESATKSRRLSAVWSQKRAKLSERKLTAKGPGWLKFNREKDRFEIIPERAAVVREIFEMSAGGMGKRRIAITLNRKNVPTFGRAEGWSQSTIRHILAHEGVIGRFQAHHGGPGRSGKPIGDLIEGYFPRIIDDALFYRAQAGRDDRLRNRPGRPGTNYANLFTGFCRCAVCGGGMIFNRRDDRCSYLICNRSRSGACSNKTAHNYLNLEDWVLHSVEQVNLLTVIDNGKSSGDELRAIEAEITAKEALVAAVVEAMGTENVKTIVEKVKRIEAELDQLRTKQKDFARQTCVASPGEGVEDLSYLAEVLRTKMMAMKKRPDELYALRVKVAAEFRRVIDRVEFHPDAINLVSKSGQSMGLALVGGSKRGRALARKGSVELAKAA